MEEYINLLQRLVNKGIFDTPKTTAPTFPRYPYPIPGGYPMPNLCNSTNWDKVYKDINGITTDDNKQSDDKSGTTYTGPVIEISFDKFDKPEKIADTLHKSFVGNQDYIDSKIIINCDDGVKLVICVDDLDMAVINDTLKNVRDTVASLDNKKK